MLQSCCGRNADYGCWLLLAALRSVHPCTSWPTQAGHRCEAAEPSLLPLTWQEMGWSGAGQACHKVPGSVFQSAAAVALHEVRQGRLYVPAS